MAFPLLAGLAGGLLKKAVPKVIGKIGGGIGKVAGKIGGVARKHPITTTVATGVGIDAAARRIGGGGQTALGGLPLIVDAESVDVLRAPPGYVLVTDPESGEKIAMLKEVAYALKLRKRPTRGGISAREIRAARRVQSVITSLTVNRVPKIKLRKGRR